MQLHFLFTESTILAAMTSSASGEKGRPQLRCQIKWFQSYFLDQKGTTQADCSALYEDLKEYGKFTGLWWLLNPEPPVANKLPMPSIEEIIFSDEFLQAKGSQEQLDCLIRRSKLDVHKIARIS